MEIFRVVCKDRTLLQAISVHLKLDCQIEFLDQAGCRVNYIVIVDKLTTGLSNLTGCRTAVSHFVLLSAWKEVIYI